jgi:methyl-accepting chemotaxis protein
MFLKFLVGCLLLATALIVGGIYVVRSETQRAARSSYVEEQANRYLAALGWMGRALGSVTDVLAHDAELARALAAPATGAPGPAAPAGAVAPGAAGASPAAAVAAALHERVAGRSDLPVTMFAVFDAAGDLVWAAPGSAIDGEDLRELEPVARVRHGSELPGRLLVHDGRALQIAGYPVRDRAGGAVRGGVLLGVPLDDVLRELRQQSHVEADKQHLLALVRDNAVVASTAPVEEWDRLAAELRPEVWKRTVEGRRERDMVTVGGKPYEAIRKPVEGFAGLTAGAIGDLVVLRPRSGSAAAEAAFPWTELTLGAAWSLVIASLLAFWITRPIKRFVRQSRRMLEGKTDLRQRIEINSRDEVSDLAENINRVFQRLYGLAHDVQGAAFQVGASSAEISAASKQMLEGLRDQTLKIEGSTAAVTELSASIQQVASNAVEATKVAERSNTAVTAAVDRMQQIRGAVEDSAQKIHELGESGKRIGNIVEVIRQISEQTTLLALNASIEAAHAGEQGRGFAVVADEVSSLARRVGQSAKDIEDLIQTIKEQTSEAVSAMQIGTREVETGTELVTVTLQDLTQLIGVVTDTAAAVQEQAIVSDEIARNMDAVQKIAAEMVSGSEEAVVQGEQLHELAFGLEQSVGGFNLDGAAAAAGDVGGDAGAAARRRRDGGGPPALRGKDGGARAARS